MKQHWSKKKIKLLKVFVESQSSIDLLLELDIKLITSYTAEKGVPDFWLNAMKTNEVLAEEVRGF